MQHLIVSIAFMLFATTALANTGLWSCRNNDLEIQCDPDNKCSVSENFTPVVVSIDESAMSVCAYSGCWEGPVRLVKLNNNNSVYVGKNLKWNTHRNNSTEFVVIINTKEKLGIIKGGSFAMPVTCVEKIKG